MLKRNMRKNQQQMNIDNMHEISFIFNKWIWMTPNVQFENGERTFFLNYLVEFSFGYYKFDTTSNVVLHVIPRVINGFSVFRALNKISLNKLV